jgi:acetyltransferase-like isoleucine patch superfamily enzyme
LILAELWRKRKRYPMGSRLWWKSWAKRLYWFPELLAFSRRREKLRRKGAFLGELSIVGEAHFGGNFSGLRIGSHSYVGRALVVLHGPVEIGDHVLINDGVTILTASHDVNDPDFTQFAAKITIGDYAWICQGVTLLPGVTIGRGAVVGAGSVVAKSVPDHAIVVGNPARATSKTRNPNLTYSPVAHLAPLEAWLN